MCGPAPAETLLRTTQPGMATRDSDLAEFGADLRTRNRLAQSSLDLIRYVEASEPEMAGGGLRSEHPLRDVMRQELLVLEPRLRTLLLFHEDFFTAQSAPGSCGPSGKWDAARRTGNADERLASSCSFVYGIDSDSPCRLAGSLLRLRDSREFKDYELDFCSEFDKAGRERSAGESAFGRVPVLRLQAGQVSAENRHSNWNWKCCRRSYGDPTQPASIQRETAAVS